MLKIVSNHFTEDRASSFGSSYSMTMEEALSFYLAKREWILLVRMDFQGKEESLLLLYKNGNYDRVRGSREDLLSMKQALTFPG